MPMDIRLKSVVEEDGGDYSVSVEFYETSTGSTLATAVAKGATVQEIEDDLRGKMIATRDKYLADQAQAAANQARMDVLRTEEGYPVGT